MKNKLEIIFEDDDLVIINKPPFFLSIPDRYKPEKPNLQTQLQEEFGKIFTLHRLDKDTSGILCFAKNEAAHKHLSLQFEHRTIQKKYLALVEGVLHQESGLIESPIAPHPHLPGRMIISSKGKPSETHYTIKEVFKNHTLLEVKIKTGRTHQIRVHLQSIGYPLAIDAVYGKNNAFLLSQIKGKKYRLGKMQEERPLMTRNSLHSFQLGFQHPTHETEMTFEAPLPKDFRAVIKQLQKWGKVNK